MAQPIWTTPAGSLGSFPANQLLSVQLVAQPILPATSLSYVLLSGNLPTGLNLSTSGSIYGTSDLVITDITSNFTVRVTDNNGNIRDRSFSIKITGISTPYFTTPTGSLLTTQDSTWVEYQILYNNPYTNNPVSIEVTQGLLPPGLEINEQGIIRGYATPPVDNLTLSSVITSITATVSATNSILCNSTFGFTVGRPIVFTGTSIGGIVASQTYYVKSIINSSEFTISVTQNGSTLILNDATGGMIATLPPVSVGTPTIRTYQFSLTLFSALGNSISNYSITIINQNTPVSQGGPGNPPNTRIPTILNTRPLTYNLTNNQYYGYYIVPDGLVYNPNTYVSLGTYLSGNYFAFKIIGYDFDGDNLVYNFSSLPGGITGNSQTGWIQGIPVLSTTGISTFNFVVNVTKTSNPSIGSVNFKFQVSISKNLNGTIIWITPENLGEIFNGSVSMLSVEASSDTELKYRITEGSLPANLTLTETGDITGYVADQPTDTFLNLGDTTTYNFTVQAYSENYTTVQSTKDFTLTVLQAFEQPVDTLYIKATPSIDDRIKLDTLLDNSTLIPNEYLYRPDDINFGKASSIIYEHAYGIYASGINDYIAAVTRNHYWRNITLGEIKTALAKNTAGEIVYEVVYSEIIDNLVNPQGISIPESIYWPRKINLNLGPWITSVTNIFTSWEEVLGQQYYTSLTPGTARTLYPDSLYNMSERVGQELGKVNDSRLLPLWMTSQQENGGTLGFTKAWVICYTKPGYAESIKNNIVNDWPFTLNQINFRLDRFSVDKSLTYNYDNNLSPATWLGLPSATPVPDPIDSKDFYVLFPRKTILPNESQ